MLKLHLAIGEDIEPIMFSTLDDLCDYVKELKAFNCVWMACTEEDDITKEEVIITENVDKLIIAIRAGFFDIKWGQDDNLFIQEYESYSEAYLVSLRNKKESDKLGSTELKDF